VKVAFACPSYGPIDPEVAHSQRFAIMTAWRNGIEVRSDIFVDRAGWDVARNIVAQTGAERLDESFDGVFWADADTVLPANAIVDVVAPGVDVCTGVYYARHPPYEPRLYIFDEDAKAWRRILSWPEHELFPIHGCGFGCIYTSRQALTLTQQVDFTRPVGEQVYWFRTGQFSEDLTWCVQARKAGFILWCNPDVVPDHLGETVKIGRKQYEEYAKEHGTAVIPSAMTLQRREDGTFDMVVVQNLDVTEGAKA